MQRRKVLRSFPTALLIWALFFAGTCTRPAKVQGPETVAMSQKHEQPLALTGERPSGFFVLAPDILASPPPVLQISITKVVNPALTPFEVLVYLAPQGKKGDPEPEKIMLGNFSLYPADQPAGFVLRSANAFKKPGATSGEVRLLIELRRIRETDSWTNLQVTIDPPKWLRDEPK
jgi:hypothetical protein